MNVGTRVCVILLIVGSVIAVLWSNRRDDARDSTPAGELSNTSAGPTNEFQSSPKTSKTPAVGRAPSATSEIEGTANGRIRGKLLQPDGSAETHSFWISLYSPGGARSRGLSLPASSTNTDSLGGFRLEGVEPGEWWLFFQDGIHSPVQVVLTQDQEVAELLITHAGWYDLNIRVVTDSGMPVPYLSLQVSCSYDDSLVTDEAGYVSVRIIADSPSIYLDYEALEPRGLLWSSMSECGRSHRDVTISLKEGHVLRGQLLPPTGGRFSKRSRVVAVASSGWEHSVDTDETGNFVVAVPKHESITLSAGVDSPLFARDERGTARLAEARLVDLGERWDDLELQATWCTASDRRLRVRVVRPDGTPLEGATVDLQETDRGLFSLPVNTDSEGIAVVEGLSDRIHQLRVGPPPELNQMLLYQHLERIVASDAILLVTLRQAIVHSVRVVDSGGRPLEGAFVRTHPAYAIATTNELGECRIMIDPETKTRLWARITSGIEEIETPAVDVDTSLPETRLKFEGEPR